MSTRIITVVCFFALQLPVGADDSAHGQARDELPTYLWKLAIVGAVVWASTDGFRLLLRAITKKLPRREIIALCLGMAAPIIAHQAEFIQCGKGAWEYVCLVFFGLIATMIAVGGHELGKRAIQAVSGGASSERQR